MKSYRLHANNGDTFACNSLNDARGRLRDLWPDNVEGPLEPVCDNFDRILVWENDEDSQNDDGSRAVCQIDVKIH